MSLELSRRRRELSERISAAGPKTQSAERCKKAMVRLTPLEHLSLRHYANEHGITVSEILRRLAFDKGWRRDYVPYVGPLSAKIARKGTP